MYYPYYYPYYNPYYYNPYYYGGSNFLFPFLTGFILGDLFW